MNDLFAGANQKAPIIDDKMNFWEELTGPGKKFDKTKYKTDAELQQALARGKYEADTTIDYFKQVQDEMRADLLKKQEAEAAGAKYDELLNLIKGNQNTNGNFTPPAGNDNEPPKINLDEIKASIKAELKQDQTLEKEQANYNLVEKTLKEQFGTNFHTVLNNTRETLGLSVDQINTLAKQSPALIFKMMGMDQQKSEGFQSPTRSTQRTDSFAPHTEKHTWSWWQQFKAKEPKKYWDPKNISQRKKDAEELGEAFADGDFYS